MHYRQIWQSEFGEIPKDENGRSYEIHHIDGNKDNDDISNLECLSIQEHYLRHHMQNDWGACFAIAKRMRMSTDEISKLLKGKTSPMKGKSYEELYGVEKARKLKQATSIRNTGRKISKETKEHWSKMRKGIPPGTTKLSKEQVEEIKAIFMYKPILTNQYKIGKVQPNGLIMNYARMLSYELKDKYKVTSTALYFIFIERNWKNVQIQF